MFQSVTPTVQKQNVMVTAIPQVILKARLETIRAEWLEATEGDLSRVTLNLGMLFDDISHMCELTQDTPSLD